MDLFAHGAVAGVNGCKGGWIAVVGGGQILRIVVSPTFAGLVAEIGEGAVIVVDMPIGLPERGGSGGRLCEAMLKRLLGKAGSSVFAIPSREAVYAVREIPRRMDEIAAAHRHALVAARRTSDPPTGFSRQALMIFPKIREIDDFLLRAKQPACIYESHPEGAFWKMNGERALEHRKKRKGRPFEPGLAERQDLLVGQGFDRAWLRAGLAEARRSRPEGVSVGADDVLDACAMAVVASRIRSGHAVPLPRDRPKDAKGLPMVIWI